ncbi:MAG: hypothetical protein JNJ90_16710 [Saprospiraceae bacterium]|jgi:hypothetical protein|nr:hypothetical protein [Saprospiraceae bacterium]
MNRINLLAGRVSLLFHLLFVFVALGWTSACQSRQEATVQPENMVSDTTAARQTTPTRASDSCLGDAALPLSERQACLRSLVCKRLRQQNFAGVLALDSLYGAGIPMPQDDWSGYHNLLDSVRTHVSRTDSLTKLNLPPDSLAFFQAASLITVCQTSCFINESCCDYSIALAALNAFTENYPQSRLADNAGYLYWSHYYCGEGGYDDGALHDMERQFRQILTRYPDTDLRDELEFQILATEMDRSDRDISKIKRLGIEYLRRFPKSPHANEVRIAIAQF